MTRSQRLCGLVLVVSVLMACGDKPAQAPPASAPPVAPVAEPPPLPEAPAAAPPTVTEPVHTPAPSAEPTAARAEKPPAMKAAKPAAPAPPEHPTVAAQPTPTVSVAAATGPCGDKGQTPCPLQGWMEHNLQQPLDAGDLARVAAGLTRVVHFAPDASWNAGAAGWDKIATDAAAAAKAGDAARVKQACKTCHKAWRAKYKASFRQRAVAD
jgi:outer membrane biosynthesis protein TonB